MEATITAKSNMQLIQEAFGNFAKGNIPAVVETCADDITWGSYKNPDTPYAGMYYGKEGVFEFFKTLAENVDYSNFEPKEFISQGDKVVVLGHHTGKVKSTGKTFDHDWAMAFTIQDGLLKHYFAFVDTRDQATAFKP